MPRQPEPNQNVEEQTTKVQTPQAEGSKQSKRNPLKPTLPPNDEVTISSTIRSKSTCYKWEQDTKENMVNSENKDTNITHYGKDKLRRWLTQTKAKRRLLIIIAPMQVPITAAKKLLPLKTQHQYHSTWSILSPRWQVHPRRITIPMMISLRPYAQKKANSTTKQLENLILKTTSILTGGRPSTQ